MFEFIKKMIDDKKEYRAMKERVRHLPEEYQFVYDKIQKYMWNFSIGYGYDMVRVQYDLVDLFEAGASEGRYILDIVGEDVAAFANELLKGTKTYTGEWGETLNRDIKERFGKKSGTQ